MSEEILGVLNDVIDSLPFKGMAAVRSFGGEPCRKRFGRSLKYMGLVYTLGKTEYGHLHCWRDAVQIRFGGV